MVRYITFVEMYDLQLVRIRIVVYGLSQFSSITEHNGSCVSFTFMCLIFDDDGI